MIDNEKTKKCIGCNKIKVLDEFNNAKRMKYGKKSRCKDCAKVLKKKYMETNKEKISEYNKKYRVNNKEKIKLYYIITDEQKEAKFLKRRETYYNKIVNFVTQNGGLCIDSINKYKNAQSKILIKCGDGHEWYSTLNKLNNNIWCPECHRFLGEYISFLACKFLFEIPFKKVRPNWLKGITTNNLELDIYNESLKLAIEYNGIQHYKYVPFFHRSMENFKKRLDYDKIKTEKCKEKGINLIIVPYTIPHNKICKFINDEASNLQLTIKGNYKEFNLSDLKHTKTLTQIITDIINEKGGKLIEGVCSNMDSIIVVKCDKDHIWSTAVKNIKQGCWCAKSTHRNISEKTKTKISTGLISYCKLKKVNC
jgi:hypothetical protein